VVLAALLGPPWFRVLLPDTAELHSTIALLRAARPVYLALVMAVPAALVLLGVAMAVARRRRAHAPGLARALAVGLSLALGMAVPEGVSAARLAAMRVPIPRLRTRFPDPPGDRIVDVVVLGESSAAGVPYDEWLSVGEMVAWPLREALPHREFPVTTLAKP